jgi:hypothetical protein
MKFILSLFFFTFISASVAAQPEIDDLKREVIKTNRVYKCLKYDYKDSMAFFKKYKNGCYMLFDNEGKRIEKNFYNEFTLKDTIAITEEVKVVFLYDKQGRNFLWLWDSEFTTPRISRIRTEKYDITGKNIGYCEINPDTGEKCDTYDNEVTRDSLVFTKGKKKHTVSMGFNKGNRKDTSYTFHHYYTNERLDSIVIFNYSYGRIDSKSVEHYFYKSGVLDRTNYTWSYDGHDTQVTTTLYMENGLLKQTDSTYYYYKTRKSEPRVTESHWKYNYSYWSKK